MSKPVKALALPPELSDGQHTVLVDLDSIDADLASHLRGWLESAADGDAVAVRCVVVPRHDWDQLEEA